MQKKECSTCHTDIHQGTVGQDCVQCHTTKTWIVSNIKQIHQQQGFTFIGLHVAADCASCHKSASLIRFDIIRTNCYSCHNVQYNATTFQNHFTDGFDKDCARCHNMTGRDWTSNGKGFNHSFFPLTGSQLTDCFKCHSNGNFSTKIATSCVGCHLTNYNNTKNPNQKTAGFPIDCEICHNSIAWVPSTIDHESYFPIKSGRHSGISCVACHTNAANYKVFTCITSSCHGIAYHLSQGSNSCYSCHSRGKSE